MCYINDIVHIFPFYSDNIQGLYNWMVQFQKLTRNLFLTLHGQNLHRQQQQLSKFLMRYQQFTRSCLLWGCGTIFQDGTVIIDLDTSKRSTQKVFSCCGAILETDPAAPQPHSPTAPQ